MSAADEVQADRVIDVVVDGLGSAVSGPVADAAAKVGYLVWRHPDGGYIAAPESIPTLGDATYYFGDTLEDLTDGWIEVNE